MKNIFFTVFLLGTFFTVTQLSAQQACFGGVEECPAGEICQNWNWDGTEGTCGPTPPPKNLF